MNIDRIITESINKIIEAKVVDTFTPYTPEQAKINKMGIGRMGNPSYDAAKKADTSPRDYGIIRGYNDWKANFSDAMDYPSYCRKFNLRR